MRIQKLITIVILLSYCVLSEEHEKEEKISFGSFEFYMYIVYALIIVCFAGLMSGLTVGYNSIDSLQLELVLNGGSDEEIKTA